MGTGGIGGNVLKYIAVKPERMGEGLTATIVGELIKYAAERQIERLFLFTKPSNAAMFEPFRFYRVAATKDVVLMENIKDGAAEFVRGLECPTKEGVIGSIVANCNPFTNGHLYLVEKAASECDLLHLFILSEDRSEFSAAVRMRLAKESTAHIGNVVVHPTSDYLISSVTFPSYFHKDSADSTAINTELDLTIFAERFAAPLNISRRYAGSEPLCPVTSQYNRQMHAILPPLGVRVIEVPRVSLDSEPVSASRVRECLAKGDFASIQKLAPPPVYAYLANQYRQFI